MMIHEITSQTGKYKSRKRIGRGHGSGSGKTSGRGHKGAGSRAGHTHRAYFEGGQMTFARRIPKRGFTNHQFRRDFQIVNLKSLEASFDDGAEITPETLAEAGLVRKATEPVKILGEGELTKKFSITCGKVSESARKKIEASGGTLTVIEKKKWVRVPGKRVFAKAKPAPKAKK